MASPYREDDIQVKPLRLNGVFNAAQTIVDAAQDDPLYRYGIDTPDAVKLPFRKRRERLEFATAAALWVKDGIGLTVNKGDAVAVILSLQKERRGRDKKIDRFIKKIASVIAGIIVPKTQEQKRRVAERTEKLEQLVKSGLGDRESQMLSLDSLATAPNCQRRGYGGALVDYVTRIADEQGRSTYLLSSNPINEPFYNHHGFFEVAYVLIGDDNPSWTKKPIRIPLVSYSFGQHDDLRVYFV